MLKRVRHQFDIRGFSLTLNPRYRKATVCLSLVAIAWLLIAVAAQAAQVQHLATQTATASGSGANGKPTLSNLPIPSGKNRALFIWVSFERDHCLPTDDCSNSTSGTNLGDNYPEPRTGMPPSTTTPDPNGPQITAQVTGPGGTVSKRNALVSGGTPSGDLRFISISTYPTLSPANTEAIYFGLTSFHIVLFENEINTLLGGAPSGMVNISFPDVSTPTGAGDDAIVIASTFQNVEQTPSGFVRNATAINQVITGTPGNFILPVSTYDIGQTPNEADDGKLVMGLNSSMEGFAVPSGHVALATPSVTNNNGVWDTPNSNVSNEPNGLTAGAYFRNGGTIPGSVYSLQANGAAATLVYGGTSSSFLLESDNADVGDAPLSYGNPSHTLSGIRLGASVDADSSLLNNASATGDDNNGVDDENGVTLVPLLPIGQTTVVPVNLQNGSGFLSAWFDWNADGDFNDPGEQVESARPVSPATTVNLDVVPPTSAVIGPTYARFRVCTNNTVQDNCNTPVGTVQSGEVEDYQFQVARALTLRKTTLGGAGGPFAFALSNAGQATGTVTTEAANTPTQVDGNTGASGTQVFAIAAPTTAVTITETTLPAGWALSNATCVNVGGTTVGTRSGNSYTISGAEVAASISFTCTFTNDKLPILRLRKALPSGRFNAGDQFILSIAGTGGPATATTTGAGNTPTGEASLTGAVGASYTLAETATAGANLATYQTSYSCTNALAGGQTPSGAATSFNVTAVVGDDLICTFTNTRNAKVDLRLTKTNTPGVNGNVDQASDTLVKGSSTSYVITVSNLGPDAANGALISDPTAAGLTCTTASCTASNGATCPTPTGAALVTALQGAGASVPILPNGGTVAITLTCAVD